MPKKLKLFLPLFALAASMLLLAAFNQTGSAQPTRTAKQNHAAAHPALEGSRLESVETARELRWNGFQNFTTAQQEPEAPPLTVDVDRSSLSTDETLLLTVTVNLGSVSLRAPQPQLPALDGFTVLGSSSSTQVSIANGDVSTETVYQYRLQPTRSGDLTIGPVSITIDDITYTSEPIQVQVSQGSSPSTAEAEPGTAPSGLEDQDFFIQAEISQALPYVGEAVTYTFRFYQADNLFNQPYYAPPDFTGFWSEEDANQRQYNSDINGRIYRVTELNTLLFPTQSGELNIEPAELKIEGGFFQSDVDLKTEAIILQVKPLPADAPESFLGAVGQFEIQAALDSEQGQVNQPLTLTVTLSGSGNIQNLPDPAWPEIEGWRSYESQATIQKEVRDGKLYGSRIYERLLVPSEPGEFTLPSISYTFFDPQAEEYLTVSTEPVSLQILPGEGEEPGTTPGQGAETVIIANDIRHIKPISPRAPDSRPLTARFFYWLAWGLPLLALGGNYAYARWQRVQILQADTIRSSRAGRKALKNLKQARLESEGQEHHPTHKRAARAAQILTTYISEKLNQPVSGLTHSALDDLLDSHSIAPDLRQWLLGLLRAGDAGRFSPLNNTEDMTGLFDDLQNLIDALEKAFNTKEPIKQRREKR